jgi:phage terminase small subunit
MSGTKAAVKAGYSVKSAARYGVELLNKPHIAQAIAQSKAKRAEKLNRTAEDVLRDIVAVTNAAMRDKDRRSALKGLELRGKHLGMFVQKVEAEHSGELVIQWGGRND